MNGENLCLQCKRFVCEKEAHGKDAPKETDSDRFLRHIRNSIAHGRVYCSHAGNRDFLLDDTSPYAYKRADSIYVVPITALKH